MLGENPPAKSAIQDRSNRGPQTLNNEQHPERVSVSSDSSGRTVITGFRAFSPEEFRETYSWQRLEEILGGNGGCYGLYGPRGSGKSWLMLKAISYADEKWGMGLWFPSPSEYDAEAFLSSLSDNLANAIERRIILNNTLTNVLNGIRRLLIFIVAVPLTVALIALIIQGFHGAVRASIFHVLPNWLWVTGAAAAYLLILVYASQLVRNNRPQGRLVREAIALRERIRFTASLKYGAELGVGGGFKALTADFKRSQEKALAERPTTIASLVFDFRNLVELTANIVRGPVVIGIDELDKMQDPEAVRALLRDVKGIFEVTGVHFLVSVSEEAAAALQIGTLQTGGRNEFNSSFYTVIELPPLDAQETEQLLKQRGYDISPGQAHALCLISAGNQREMVRIADATIATLGKQNEQHLITEEHIILSAMQEESSALLREIIRIPDDHTSGTLSAEAKSGAWKALPRQSFQSVRSFIALGKRAIVDYWEPSWADGRWGRANEPWRRLLLRLFITASLLDSNDKPPQSGSLLSNELAIADLLGVMIMTGQDAGVARVMLQERFGVNLSEQYQLPAGTL